MGNDGGAKEQRIEQGRQSGPARASRFLHVTQTAATSRRDATLPLGVSVHHHPRGRVLTVVLHRPSRRNAVDGPTAAALHATMRSAEADPTIDVIVLHGAGGVFCAGADLMAMDSLTGEGGRVSTANPLLPVDLTPDVAAAAAASSSTVLAHTSDIGPMGLSRLELTKPVIAAIAGPAVAGGLELACWHAKPASRIVQRLRDNKKEVHLVNPRAPSDAEPKVHGSLAELVAATPIDVLDLVINSADGLKQLSAVPESTKLSVWIQPGAASDEIRQLCKNRQWPVHEGCVLVEMKSKL